MFAITLIDVNTDYSNPNIGTMVSKSGSEKEFKKKATKAIESHFDGTVKEIQFPNESVFFLTAINNDPFQIKVIMIDGYSFDVEIQQTWIY